MSTSYVALVLWMFNWKYNTIYIVKFSSKLWLVCIKTFGKSSFSRTFRVEIMFINKMEWEFECVFCAVYIVEIEFEYFMGFIQHTRNNLTYFSFHAFSNHPKHSSIA